MRPTDGLSTSRAASMLVACHERSHLCVRASSRSSSPRSCSCPCCRGVVTAAQPKDTKAAHHAKVVKYWTPERIKNAKPRDFVFDPAKGTFKPAAKPAAPAAAAATSPAPRGPAAATSSTATGRVLFTLGGGDYICSGSVVNDGTTTRRRSIVLTAGHCASENDGATVRDELDVHPVVRHRPDVHLRARRTYGCWVADALYGDTAFVNAGGFNNTAVQHDWGFAVVSTGGKQATSTLQLDATVGVKFPIAVLAASRAATR